MPVHLAIVAAIALLGSGPPSAADPTRGGGRIAAEDPADPPEPPCWTDETGWHVPEEIGPTRARTALHAFSLLADRFSAERFFGAAEERAERWLHLDEVEVGRREVRVRKAYGGRLSLLSFAGLGGAQERGVRADYRLGRGFSLRSETRERGESFMELRREFAFP